MGKWDKFKVGGGFKPTQINVGTSGVSTTYKPIGSEKEEIGYKIAEEKARKSIKAPFEIMSSEDRATIQEMKNIPNILSRVRELSDIVPEDRASAIAFKARMDTPLINNLLTSKEQRELKTNTVLLIQTVVKSFQGSRPSDRDLEVINAAINSIGEGRENFNAALNELGKLAARRADSYVTTAAKGWGIPRKDLEDLVELSNIKKLSENNNQPIKKQSNEITAKNPKTGERIKSLDGGKTWQKM